MNQIRLFYAYLNQSSSFPRSPSIIPSLFYSRLKTCLFSESFPPWISHHRHSGLTFSANGTIFRFYRATQLRVSVVLGIVILSVCPSVRLSVCHTCALWQNQTMHCGYFDTTRKGNHFSFLTSTVVGGRRPLPSEICAQSDPLPSKSANFDSFPPITSQP